MRWLLDKWYNKIEVHIKSSTLLVNEKFFKTTYMLCNHTVSAINFVFHTEHDYARCKTCLQSWLIKFSDHSVIYYYIILLLKSLCLRYFFSFVKTEVHNLILDLPTLISQQYLCVNISIGSKGNKRAAWNKMTWERKIIKQTYYGKILNKLEKLPTSRLTCCGWTGHLLSSTYSSR